MSYFVRWLKNFRHYKVFDKKKYPDVWRTLSPWKKFISDLRQDDGFLRVLRFPPLIKLTATI
jgi:hypothetical protein